MDGRHMVPQEWIEGPARSPSPESGWEASPLAKRIRSTRDLHDDVTLVARGRRPR